MCIRDRDAAKEVVIDQILGQFEGSGQGKYGPRNTSALAGFSLEGGAQVSTYLAETIRTRKPEIDAKLVAENIAQKLERRVAFRWSMKRSVQSAMRLGAAGVRINCSGRLGGAEIARTEWYREGRVPLHTLRADVDYGEAEANTTYGICGIKVWIFKGEIMEHDPLAQEKRLNETPGQARN